MKEFRTSIVYTGLSLIVAALYGGLPALIIVLALGCLETSLSMDNAVVNAKTLAGMSSIWQKRFLTWGIVVAVFGMRLLFPLLVVSIAAWITPQDALRMAIHNPEHYASVLASAHIQITGFGGAFLMMLFFDFFLDDEKEIHWIGPVERCLTRLGHMHAIGVACTTLVLLFVSLTLDTTDGIRLLQCGMAGIVGYILAEGAADLVGGADEAARALAKAGLAGFIYLEIQDASFSFDGVVGALAVSNNLVLIALGLGIGAMFVRSITLVLVERGTLKEMLYLEHGAFWAVGCMAAVMFLKLHVNVPDVFSGLMMAAIIAGALASSMQHVNSFARKGARA